MKRKRRAAAIAGSLVVVLALAALGADTKISALSAVGTLHSDDLLMDVDVHDATMGPAGTNKKLTVSQLFGTPSAGNLIGWQGTPTAIAVGSGLSLTGTGPYTLSASGGSGTVTSVATGSGLTGGPITTTGTVSLAAIAAGNVLANVSGGVAAPGATTPSAVLDTIGSTQGGVLYRGASGWSALSPGTSGQILTSGGASANPSWTTVGGSGTVTSVGLTVPSWLTVAGSPVTTSGTLAVTAAGAQAANQFVASPNGTTGAVSLRSIVAADIPTLNQSTTGTAANVTGTVAVANGGTGQATQQAAMNALAGTQSAGKYLRSDGTNTTLATIQAADVPTLNQSTTGTAANVTGTVAIANGGTGQATAAAAYNALSPMTTLGDLEYESGAGTAARLAGNTAATRKFLRQTGSGTVSAAPAWDVLQSGDLPAGTGTVTSVGLSAPSWLTVSGSPVTAAGTLALTAAGAQAANQVLATPNGSSGAVGLRALAAADLPTTGLNVTSHFGAITTDTDGATVTMDLSVSDWHQVQIAGNRTLALSNPTTGQQFSVIVQQDATGSRTVAWFSGVLWPGGTVPTLTTTASKRDVFTFKCVSSGVYLGFVAGQNL